jgi:PAS domain S-box-containing protein
MTAGARKAPPRRRTQTKPARTLRARLEDAEDLLRAFTGGEVDAILRPGSRGQQVYTLEGADHVYRLMVETMSEGAVTLSPEGVILYANRRFADLLGRDLDQVIGRRIQDFAEPTRQGMLDELLQKSQEEDMRCAMDLQRSCGTSVAVHLAMRGLEVEGMRCTIAVVTDLSEVKRSERELHLADERLGLAMEAAPTGLLLMDPAGLIVQVNAQIEKVLGYPRAELHGRPFEQFVPKPLDPDRSAPRPEPTEAGSQEHAPDMRDALRKNGCKVPVELAHTPFQTSRGELILVSVVDLSSRRELERARTEFVSMVSHELRTPLTAIIGSLGLLQTGALGKLPHASAEMVEIAYKNGTRLQRLISDILDIGAIDSGNLTTRVGIVPLADALEQSVEASAGYAEKYGVRFVFEGTAADAQVLADPHRLVQVVANLLSNAAKFSPPGADVRIRVREELRMARVEVEDSGAGIPETFRSHVFERFSQADSSAQRRFEGAGLGLSIARKLIEAMGGRIGFSTVTGQGSIFYIEVPLSDAVPAAPADR